ncbi:ecto-ADP-ribosyltransferase 5-like isoform X1 [Gopherus flavomarginatus]|uniref:ecto-ADP-ribosyltransferase 5-like isoform X1 n=1 Tax=Gopherus flavomarginatus TaxID=286002 RepID=UPI0021CC3D79|nr:ecto-ADP-ribosyltransferase 5-like isoform X1 [Gopherus flavomarginatus]
MNLPMGTTNPGACSAWLAYRDGNPLTPTEAKCQEELSMMSDAFDDQYIGCAEEMDGIAPELLEKEKSKSSLFRTVWENAEKEWECVKKEISLPKGFKDEYGRAIVAYTDNDFHSELNAAVRGAGTSRAHYMASFQFKAFHYYLTRASQLLRGRCDVMYNMTVYRGVSAGFQHTRSGDIRFGHFASSSIKEEVAERYSTKNLSATPTLFTIQTCFGVKIWNFSYSPPDEEVLIPVHEIFNMPQGQRSNCFVLRSTNRTCSHFNCAYLGGEKTQTCVYHSGTPKISSLSRWMSQSTPCSPATPCLFVPGRTSLSKRSGKNHTPSCWFPIQQQRLRDTKTGFITLV